MWSNMQHPIRINTQNYQSIFPYIGRLFVINAISQSDKNCENQQYIAEQSPTAPILPIIRKLSGGVLSSLSMPDRGHQQIP